MANRSNKKITIVDVARASGVSITTVSRILNNKPDVAEETRQRVLQTIEVLGFSPHLAWQQLRSGKSRFIALHFPQDFNPPTHGIITSAAMSCEDAGYLLNLIANPLSDNDLLSLFRTGQTDGIILMEILTHDRRVELLRDQDLPFVMIGRCADNTALNYVDFDIGKGINDILQYLVALGHRQIGFVTLSPVLQEKEYGYTTWALKGYEKACQQYHLPNLWHAVGIKNDIVSAGVTNLLNDHPEITAIVTPQEYGIPGMLKAIQSKGLRIPEDISVVGLLSETMSELMTPPLTTITFPEFDMGREAARILIAQLTGTLSEPQHVLIPPEITVRGSAGPAPTR